MINMVEFEKKFMLSEQEYETLYSALGKAKGKTHFNYYYDTTDLAYNKKGITCRIRKKDSCCIATIKRHRRDYPECNFEKYCVVKNEKDKSFFKGMDVIFQGVLTTERKEIIAQNGINAVLDKNTYLGITDYELEIEYSPYLKQNCDDILKLIVKRLTKKERDSMLASFKERMNTGGSKSERFFKRKKEIQGGTKNALSVK